MEKYDTNTERKSNHRIVNCDSSLVSKHNGMLKTAKITKNKWARKRRKGETG